jgi:hypothetical protein
MQRLRAQGIDAFRFLSNQIIVVARRILAVLELYTLPVPKSDAGPTLMTKVAALGLPSVDEGCWIRHLGFYNLPPKSVVSHMRQQLRDTSIFAKPFTVASPDDIIFVSVEIRSKTGFDVNYFVVHSSTLQRHAVFIPHAILQDTIPWQMWGPTTTRWFQSEMPSRTDVYGQRCLLQGPTSKEIWDFNQYRVRYLGQCFAMESEAACLSVETEPSCVTSIGLGGGVYSSLPYVKLVLKQLKNDRTTCLDDDRIFYRRVSPSHSSPSSDPFFDDIATVRAYGGAL